MLAINGGKPLRTSDFPAWPQFDEAEQRILTETLNQGNWWRVANAQVDSFEKEFANYHGAACALAVTNGTHALELALLTLDIGPGDEVIVPSFTFISTSLAVQRVGAVPIPVDVKLGTYALNSDMLEDAITPRTKAIIPVHPAGQIIDMEHLIDVCEKHNIQIIQDAAHAHGATRNHKKIGEFATMACFSFQNFKLMTAGEGGAILFPNQALYEKAFLLHNCGRPLGDLTYRHELLGSNYRMNEFSAAILRVQLTRLEAQNKLRDQHAALLSQKFTQLKGLVPQSREPGTTLHSYYMFMFRIDRTVYPELDRDTFVRALVAEGIPAYRNYPPIYETECFWQSPCCDIDKNNLSQNNLNTQSISYDGIWIHHRVLLGDEKDVLDVFSAVQKVLKYLTQAVLA